MNMSFHGIRINNPLIILSIGLLINNILWSSSTTEAQSLPGCPDRCGDLKVPYPFGMAKGCYLADNFFITCNRSFQPAPRAFLNRDHSLLLSNISLNGELSILQLSVARYCHNQSYDSYHNRGTLSLPAPDTVSDTRLRNITVSLSSLGSGNHSWERQYWLGSMACSYTFVVEESKFLTSKRRFVKLEESTTSISFDQLKNTEMLPLTVNWAIGNERCEKAKRRSNFSCKANSICVDPSIGSGYLCRCLPGYQGNPYHPNGCQDIDECELSNRCENGKCQNLPGSWSCICPTGYVRTESGCTKPVSANYHSGKRSLRYIALAGTCLGLLTLLVSSYVGIYWAVKKRNFRKVREKLFEKNGGLMLKQYLDAGHSNTLIKIFTAEELAWATNNFHEKSIIKGSFGKTYKGILAGKFVVIKQSKIADPAYIEKFINAVICLSQIKHKNAVELLGCCLETEIPFLVYEFVKNGSLSQYFHQNGLESSLSSRELRLTIATDIARALAYMHYEAPSTITHGNVTPSNIYLDEDYAAKLDYEIPFCNDPIEQGLDGVVRIIGTLGYIDPECFLSREKTKKSDVYSFGVVLIELLTG
ncbi:hypothetical protein FNV43_RR06344 [Rhamnella rubrinervis]|uniref:Uncharacterized protein n=1 Tax=Rhamnella rubrinervis TaxID=2594499 RepID=A0A8K0HDM7_9ROSA|nr:hypothetical protein FNV43_RR06344 [Rhamnella rubrinervis]